MLKILADENVAPSVVAALRKEGNVISSLIPFLKNIETNKIKNRLVVFQEGKIRII